MDILYISPDFPPNYANFIRHLHAAGLRVWSIGEADFFAMPADLRACIRWYVRGDLKNWREVDRAVGELLEAKHALGFEGAFDLVESHNEQWLRLEGFINERLGIAGITLRDTDRLKKKSVMKRIFNASGLPVARGGRVTDLDEALRRAGARGVRVRLLVADIIERTLAYDPGVKFIILASAPDGDAAGKAQSSLQGIADIDQGQHLPGAGDGHRAGGAGPQSL